MISQNSFLKKDDQEDSKHRKSLEKFRRNIRNLNLNKRDRKLIKVNCLKVVLFYFYDCIKIMFLLLLICQYVNDLEKAQNLTTWPVVYQLSALIIYSWYEFC